MSDDEGDTGSGGPSTVETVVMIVSVAFTLLLIGFVVWQALTTPTGVTPTASVTGVQPMADGTVRVAVELRNPNDVGIEAATVEVNCTTPPPEIRFEHVAATGTAAGYVECPGGTTDPDATLASWIPA